MPPPVCPLAPWPKVFAHGLPPSLLSQHIDFALTSPFGGGPPGRVKRKKLASKAAGGDDEEEDE